jgi:tetratricopeptide (TPR) repeat protein
MLAEAAHLRRAAQRSIDAGELDQAATLLDTAIALDPVNEAGFGLMLTALRRAGRVDEVESWGRLATGRLPTSTTVLREWALARLDAGDGDGAIDLLDQALNVHWFDETAHAMRISLLRRFGRAADADRWAGMVSSQLPWSPLLLVERALAKMALSELDQARELLDRAVALLLDRGDEHGVASTVSRLARSLDDLELAEVEQQTERGALGDAAPVGAASSDGPTGTEPRGALRLARPDGDERVVMPWPGPGFGVVGLT